MWENFKFALNTTLALITVTVLGAVGITIASALAHSGHENLSGIFTAAFITLCMWLFIEYLDRT
jgi:hypothetical protein